MSKTAKKNMIGLRYGILTVLSEVKERNKNGHILYNVKCDCGKEKIVLGHSLRTGASRSCNKCHLLTGGHGMWKSKEFSVWGNMKDRCTNPNNPRYKNYGGKGIIVCERWVNSFPNFFSDMGESNGLTLERKDVSGNYEPNNCKWADAKEQARNRTNNVRYTYEKETLCVSEWCEKLNMKYSTFTHRIQRGWSIEETIETPVITKHRKQFVKDE